MADGIFDAAIVGGGAAGLAAAVSYLKRETHGRLLLIEANDALGKKLLATGNGRCNILNLSSDDYLKIKAFFGDIGVLFRVEEGGRVYPMSGQAASVRDALVAAFDRLGGGGAKNACARLGARVARVGLEKSASPTDAVFRISFEDEAAAGGDVFARRLLVATGGKAGPQYGCFGDGYAFARGFGHSVESIRPALVPLVYSETDRQRLAGLKGVRIRSRAELLVDGRHAAAASGELQFTEYGLSGVMIFDVSTMMPKSVIEEKPRTEICVDLAPGEKEETLERVVRENDGLLLAGVVGKKLSDFLARESGGDPARMAALAKNFVVRVVGTKGWKEAQATLGGVRVSEINEDTGESLLCKNLFFAGESLEPVYICGGFNLGYAWATGLRAGSHL